jgi:hypothetical protein
MRSCTPWWLRTPGLAVAHDDPRQLGGVGVGELLVRLGHDLAVDLDGRRKVGGDEEVGPFF